MHIGTFGLPYGSIQQQNPLALSQYGWGLSPYGTPGLSPIVSAQQPVPTQPYFQQQQQPFQQVLQSLQFVPAQLQQIQQLAYYQQQQVQYLLQIVAAQLQQIQQTIQFIPQQVHQLQQQVPGQQFGSPAGVPFQPASAFGTPFTGQPVHVM